MPVSDGKILKHKDDVYEVQIEGMRGRIDARGFHCAGYLNPLIASHELGSSTTDQSAPLISSADGVESGTSQANPCVDDVAILAAHSLAVILGPDAFDKDDYKSLLARGPSDRFVSKIKASLGDDYGGWAFTDMKADTADGERSRKRKLQQLRRLLFLPGAGRFYAKDAYNDWRKKQNPAGRRFPTVAELRAEGYMSKHFRQLEGDAADCIQQVLLEGPVPLGVYRHIGVELQWYVQQFRFPFRVGRAATSLSECG